MVNVPSLLIFFGFLPGVSGAMDLVLGHFEYQLDYRLEEGWRASVSYDRDGSFANDEGVLRLDPDQVRLLAAPSTRVLTPNPPAGFGVADEPLWILSQNNNPGELFLGWRAIYPQGIFQAEVGGNFTPSPLGSIASTLVEVGGTGPARGGGFAMWTSSGFGSLEFHFNSNDGIDGKDRLGPIPAGSHSHYNWGFTRPGTYDVRFRNEGKLNPQFGGEMTTSEALLHFVVPHEGFLEGRGKWRLGSDEGSPPVSLFDEEKQVDYAADQVALMAADGRFEMMLAGPTDLSLGRVGLGEVAGMAFPGEGPVEVSLRHQMGPGTVDLSRVGETDRFEFGADGIYRVQLQARRGEVTGEPFTLTFLVNRGVDYSYEQWARSFEQAHGLTTGQLSERTADFDHDGVGNGLEFLLFWHGLDPAVPDRGKMPRPRWIDGRAEIEFLRDLHKDDFATTPLELAAAFSPDLQAPWRPWRRLFAEGEPDGFFEYGSERGNETSFVMRRKLVVPDAPENFGFFRFEQRSRN